MKFIIVNHQYMTSRFTYLPTIVFMKISDFLGSYWPEGTELEERVPAISVLYFTCKSFPFSKHFIFGWFDTGVYVWTYNTVNYLWQLNGPTLFFFESHDNSRCGLICYTENRKTRHMEWNSTTGKQLCSISDTRESSLLEYNKK